MSPSRSTLTPNSVSSVECPQSPHPSIRILNGTGENQSTVTLDLRRPQQKMSKNPLSALNRRHFSCSFPSGTSSSCLYLTVILKFLISPTMCKLKLKEIIPYFFSSKVQLLSKNSSQSRLCFASQQEQWYSVLTHHPHIPVHSTWSCSLFTHQHSAGSFA